MPTPASATTAAQLVAAGPGPEDAVPGVEVRVAGVAAVLQVSVPAQAARVAA